MTVPSFRPEIDSNSAKIESRSKSRGRSAERCQALYEMHKELKSKREAKVIEREKEKERLELEQASFKPAIGIRSNMSETAAALSAIIASVQKPMKNVKLIAGTKSRHIRSASNAARVNTNKQTPQVLKPTDNVANKNAGILGCRGIVESNKEIKEAMKTLHEELMSIPM